MEKKVVRWSGLVLIIGAVLLGTEIVLATFVPYADRSSLSPLTYLLLLLSGILLMLSLPAMYALQASASGWIGFAGHVLLQTGTLLLVVAAYLPISTPSLYPPASGENAVSFFFAISMILGVLLTAIATIRAGVFPRWAGILLLAVTPGLIFAIFIGDLLPGVLTQVVGVLLGILMAVAFAWVGVAMLQQSRAQPQLQ